MLRLVLTFALSLLALPALAQTDPRTPTGGTAPEVVVPPQGAAPGTARVTGTVLVGEHAPEFALDMAGGGQCHLKQFRGRWVALFFTDRRDDLPRLAHLAATLDSLHLATIVVLNEKVQALAQWRAASTSVLTALGDDRGEIASVYGLWDAENGVTRPGLFLLDPQGVVRLELLGQRVGGPSLRGLVQTAVEGL